MVDLNPKDKIFKVIVKPNSSKNEIIGYDEARQGYLLNIKARPEDGKANIMIIKFLTKEIGKPVEIMSGKASRQKLIRILE
jgi:uncharacterized protein (TIGR00251 family)